MLSIFFGYLTQHSAYKYNHKYLGNSKKEAVVAIYSNTFGGLRLSGEDAVKFRNQVRYGRPSKAAKETANRGRQMAEAFARDGFVVVDITTK